MTHLKYLKIILIAIGINLFLSCSKDDDINSNPITVEQTVNDITISVEDVETPVAPNNPGNYSVWFSKVGNEIYYANPSNTANPQFMLAYNMTTNTFTPKTTDTEICSCGYSSKIVSNGEDLFYIGSDAVSYSVSSDSWQDLSYPADFQDNNGETGIVVFNNKIYFFGGRTATAKFKYYDINTDTWYNLADGPYENNHSEMVVVGNTIYNLGGDEDVNYHRFYSYTNEIWTELPNLPFEFRTDRRAHLTASLGDRYLFVLDGSDIQVYDTQKNEWKSEPISLDIADISYKNLFAHNHMLYVVGKTSTNDFTLHKIDVNY